MKERWKSVSKGKKQKEEATKKHKDKPQTEGTIKGSTDATYIVPSFIGGPSSTLITSPRSCRSLSLSLRRRVACPSDPDADAVVDRLERLEEDADGEAAAVGDVGDGGPAPPAHSMT